MTTKKILKMMQWSEGNPGVRRIPLPFRFLRMPSQHTKTHIGRWGKEALLLRQSHAPCRRCIASASPSHPHHRFRSIAHERGRCNRGTAPP